MRSGRRLASRHLMPTVPRKSARCGGSLGLELDEHASIFVGHPRFTFVASHTHFGFPYKSKSTRIKLLLYVPIDTNFILCTSESKRNSNICANAFLSFMPLGIVCYLPMNVVQYGRVPFFQGTGYIQPHRVTNQSKAAR